MKLPMLASTTTLFVDTNEFITGKVMGCNAEGSTFSELSLTKLVVDNTVSEDVGVKGKEEPEAVLGSISGSTSVAICS